MRALMVVAVLVMGCGPYGSSKVGQTCDAGPRVQSCSSSTTYQACDTSGFPVWREYPCKDTCAENGACDLSASKAGDACSPSWAGVGICKAPRLALSCRDGGWVPSTCDECPAGASCLACACASAASLAGRPCDSAKDLTVCEVDGKATTCIGNIWQQYPCNACRAGVAPTCNTTNGTCSCD